MIVVSLNVLFTLHHPLTDITYMQTDRQNNSPIIYSHPHHAIPDLNEGIQTIISSKFKYGGMLVTNLIGCLLSNSFCQNTRKNSEEIYTQPSSVLI